MNLLIQRGHQIKVSEKPVFIMCFHLEMFVRFDSPKRPGKCVLHSPIVIAPVTHLLVS